MPLVAWSRNRRHPLRRKPPLPRGKALFRGPGSCPTAIYMSAIPRANCLNPLMKKNPPKKSVNSWAVIDLFVDRDVTSIPRSLCECAGYLNSVAFEAGTKLDSAGAYR